MCGGHNAVVTVLLAGLFAVGACTDFPRPSPFPIGFRNLVATSSDGLEATTFPAFPADCAALRTLYNATGGHTSWYVQWDLEEENCCTNWSGVACVDPQDTSDPPYARVVAIALLANGLNGTIPSDISKLSKVETIQINSNPLLSGTIPAEIFQLQEVTIVALYDNSLQGTLHTEWLSMPKLASLELAFNELEGSLPDSWAPWNGYLLSLSANNLSGTLPTAWSEMAELEFLSLAENSFHGTLPSEWETMESLTYLELSRNSLEGTLPAVWGNLGRLAQLWLEHNNFSGFLPLEWRSLPSLSFLSLSHNNLEGYLPFAWWQINTLGYLSVSGNVGINGSLPEWTPSRTLDVSNTSISGPIRRDIFAYDVSFDSLDISHTLITGELPLRRLQSERSLTLDVTGVNISGPANGLVFSPSARETFHTYSCRALLWPTSVRVTGVTPFYYDFDARADCRCSIGYSGTPPMCQPTSHAVEFAVIGVMTTLVIVLGAVVAVPRVRRWLHVRADLRKAEELLRRYTGHRSMEDVLTLGLTEASHDSQRLQQQWRIDFKDLMMVRTIASGASGSVSLALWNRTYVAVKVLHSSVAEDDEQGAEFLSEAELLGHLRHPNVVQLFGVCFEPRCLVCEWMDRGSLFDVMRHDPHSLPRVARVALDIARGMLYLHRRNVLHRDLKSMNVLIDSDNHVKVCDLGHSRTRSEQTMTQCRGTGGWMAPEMFGGSRYDERCDVYSFGVVLWELLSGDIPFKDVRFAHQIEALVSTGQRPLIPETDIHGHEIDDRLKRLTQRCWAQQREDRPTFDEIVETLEEVVADQEREQQPGRSDAPRAHV